jgi:hypothetical protein
MPRSDGFPRRLISEIAARYEFEPQLDDVYVEGVFDKEVLDAIFQGSPADFRPCYVVDDIDVSPDILHKHGLSSGNRQRLIALAAELALPKDTSVRVLVDRDFEDWHPTLPPVSGLVKTKYCDVETCFFDEDFVKRILLDGSRCKISNWDEFFSSLKGCLREIYCIRLELVRHSFNVGLIDYSRLLKLSGCRIMLDRKSIISRSLSRSYGNEVVMDFDEKVSDRLDVLPHDPHQMVSRGHDFIHMMAWSVRALKGVKVFQDEMALARLIVMFASEQRINLLEPLSS